MRLRINADKPVVLGDIILRAAAPNVGSINKILQSVHSKQELLNDLLIVGQYDITSHNKVNRRVKSCLKRVKKATGLTEKSIKELTSGTELFEIVLYYAIKDELLDKYNLYMYMEPEILKPSMTHDNTYTFDYAIVDENKKRVLILAEVKRLRGFSNFPIYTEYFLNKLEKIYNSCDHFIYHLHLTPEVQLLHQYANELKNIFVGINKILKRLTRIDIVITSTPTHGKEFSDFKEQLLDAIGKLF